MSSEEKSDHLVANIFIGELVVRLGIFAVNHSIQEIINIVGMFAPFSNNLIAETMELSNFVVIATIGAEHQDILNE